jgi:hypothetical protein
MIAGYNAQGLWISVHEKGEKAFDRQEEKRNQPL